MKHSLNSSLTTLLRHNSNDQARVQIEVSVVIVTWNSWSLTRRCLMSLQEDQCTPRREIIVVDNGSSDGTPDLIRKQFPQIRLIENARNEGFARATNKGIRCCQGEYICLINSDVVVMPNCVERSIAFMEHNPSVGLLGPKMLGPGGETRRSCMRFPTLWSMLCRAAALDRITKARLFGGFLMRDFAHDRIQDVDVLNGWFWVVRRRALERVGPLDERFFIYGEDLDWCYRFKNGGWRVVFYPEVSSVHYGGGSSRKDPIHFYLEKQRATLCYWIKYHGRLSRYAYLVIIVSHEVLRICGYGISCLIVRSELDNARYKMRQSITCLLGLWRGLCLQQGPAQ